MMKFISHRGNISGKNVALENSPEYIDAALARGYDVEIDVRLIGDKLYLGHDTPDYEISLSWLIKRKNSLYIHAKSIDTAQFLSTVGGLHFFFHAEDACTITSQGVVWVHPKSKPFPNTVFVMPEYCSISMKEMLECSAICTDDVIHYEQEYNILKVVHNERQKN